MDFAGSGRVHAGVDIGGRAKVHAKNVTKSHLEKAACCKATTKMKRRWGGGGIALVVIAAERVADAVMCVSARRLP